jgi:hypothetical protein
MDKLRVPIILNKGRIGIPLHKLGAIVRETETFLKMLADDISLPGNRGEWLALDFKNGSLIFTAEYIPPVSKDEIITFAHAIKDIKRGVPAIQIRDSTRYQYAKIAEQLDEDEEIEIGVCEKHEDIIKEAFEYISLAKRDLPQIVRDIHEMVESSGSVQGIIHSVFMRSSPKHFNIRELSTDNLIICEYPSALYPQLAKVLREESMVVHVYGIVKTDMVNRKIEKIITQRIEAAPAFISEEEFNEFFGSSPNFTGNLSTQEFIDNMRDRNE